MDAFKLRWEETLASPLDSKEIKPVNPERKQPFFIERTIAKAESSNTLAT